MKDYYTEIWRKRLGLPRQHLGVAFLALAYLLGCFSPKQFVQAECTLPPDFHISLPQERTAGADVVLLGTIGAEQTSDNGYPGGAFMVQVEEYLKGTSGTLEVLIQNFGPSENCLSTVQTGQRWLIYADGDPNTALLFVSYIEPYSGISAPTDQAIAAVREVVAGVQQPSSEPPTPLPTDTPLPPATVPAEIPGGVDASPAPEQIATSNASLNSNGIVVTIESPGISGTPRASDVWSNPFSGFPGLTWLLLCGCGLGFGLLGIIGALAFSLSRRG